MREKLTEEKVAEIILARYASENSGYVPTEEEKKIIKKRSDYIHKMALEELKKQGYKI